MRGKRIEPHQLLERGALAVALMTLTLATAAAGTAEGGQWTIEIEPLLMDAYGHDQHVLTTHDSSFTSAQLTDNQTAVSLDTNSGGAYRGTFLYSRGKWGWGVDYLWFNTSQDAPDRSALRWRKPTRRPANSAGSTIVLSQTKQRWTSPSHSFS